MRRIRAYLLGWPGSVHDSTVFGKTDIAINPQRYFSQGQYIIGDSAYPSSFWMLTQLTKCKSVILLRRRLHDICSPFLEGVVKASIT